MLIDSLEVIIYTFQFIIPGYIIREVISSILPQKNYSEGEKAIQSIGYSVLNIAIWYWLFLIIQDKLQNDSVRFWLCNTLVTVLTGFITGTMLGIVRAKNLVKKLFNRLGVNVNHPVPTAWDYKFSKGEKQWVEITVSNGGVIRGLYAGKSLSSSENEYRDIYLEELYVKEDETWEKVSRTSGVWINPDEIRYIKFYTMEEEENV